LRILITNDDGINAPGLEILGNVAAELAGENGEVWTVAPALEQSGVGHCISFTKPMMLTDHGPRRIAVEGTPADCVLAGFYDVLGGHKPDLVLSGINRGNNAAENTLYSGTIGATIEAALHGVRSVALSQYFGPDNKDAKDPFDAARTHAVAVIRKLLEQGIWQDSDYGIFYNVNFPPVAASNVRGTKMVAQGFRRNTDFGVEPYVAPNARRYLWIRGGPQHTPTAAGTDAWANLEGYTSVTPMRVDLTAHSALAQMQSLFA